MSIVELSLVLLVIVGIIWGLKKGVKKIPDLARILGTARGEFYRAYREHAGFSENESDTSSDYMLVERARKLGISVKGKTRAQISQEINARTESSNP